MAFEELQALIDNRDIEITELPEDVPDNASFFGKEALEKLSRMRSRSSDGTEK